MPKAPTKKSVGGAGGLPDMQSIAAAVQGKGAQICAPLWELFMQNWLSPERKKELKGGANLQVRARAHGEPAVASSTIRADSPVPSPCGRPATPAMPWPRR